MYRPPNFTNCPLVSLRVKKKSKHASGPGSNLASHHVQLLCLWSPCNLENSSVFFFFLNDLDIFLRVHANYFMEVLQFGFV